MHRSSETHIVDTLIEERAPKLSQSFLWPILRTILRLILNYRQARGLADSVSSLSGPEAVNYVSDLLDLTVETTGLDNIPIDGPVVIVCNHPTGVADGIAVHDALIAHRPDLCFFANADAHRVCPGLMDNMIPVAWPATKRTLTSTKLTLRMAKKAIGDHRAIIVFPAGALSRRIKNTIQDPKWEHSAFSLAKKHKLPIIPIHVSGPRPRLFLLFDHFSRELRDVTLFHELLNKRGKTYKLTIGRTIDTAVIDGPSTDVTKKLKAYVETILPISPDLRFGDPS